MRAFLISLCLIVAPIAAPRLALSATPPSPIQLAHEIHARLAKVEEFRFIREQAQKLGIRVWLFGGTASAYGHYVRWDLARKQGDARFQKDRFDYDYTNIYRSTQDLDIVVDGTPAQAAALESALQKQFPHLQGSKPAWEVRLLRQSMGAKVALLDNPDFLGQHTDSNSTGLIELSEPPAGELAVKDLRDWSSEAPEFLRDLAEGKLHYYSSLTHGETSRFREGLNPEIFSVLRYLTKAFQYHLEIRPADLAKIREIIARFDPARDLSTDYAKGWIEKNGSKLIQHAVDIEYAWDTLEKLQLRKKLLAIRNDPHKEGSLAWWMNKEPLRSSEIGRESGRTAKEIFGSTGPIVVAHETNSYLAYESITRAHTGEPNVLISRQKGPGESAVHGDGFYTRIGRQGARDTGFTIRFELKPEAREGSDFTLHEDFVLVLNKRAIRVIPESLSLSVIDFFERAAAPASFNHSDRGIWERLKRRLDAKRHIPMTPEEEARATAIMMEHIERHKSPHLDMAREWFALPVSAKRTPEAEKIIASLPWNFYSRYVLAGPLFRDRIDDLIEAAAKNPAFHDSLVVDIFSDPAQATRFPHLVSQIIQHGKNLEYPHALDSIQKHILAKPEARAHPEWMLQAMIANRAREVSYFGEESPVPAPFWLAKHHLSAAHWAGNPDLIRQILADRLVSPADILQFVLSKPAWGERHPELITEIVNRHPSLEVLKSLVEHILSKPFAAQHPEWIRRAFAWGAGEKMVADVYSPYSGREVPVGKSIAMATLKHAHWADHPELIRHAMRYGHATGEELLLTTLHENHWIEKHPELITEILAQDPRPEVMLALVQNILIMPAAADHPEWMRKAIQRSEATSALRLATVILARPHWAKHPELLRLAIDRKLAPLPLIVEKVLSQPEWADRHPDLVLELMQRDPSAEMSIAIAEHVLSKDFAKNHPEWIPAFFGRKHFGMIYPHGSERVDSREWVYLKLLSRGDWATQAASLIRQNPTMLEALLKLSMYGLRDHRKALLASWTEGGDIEKLQQAFWEGFTYHTDPARPTEWIEEEIQSARGIEFRVTRLLDQVLVNPYWIRQPQWANWLRRLLPQRGDRFDPKLYLKILSVPESARHPELLEPFLFGRWLPSHKPTYEPAVFLAKEILSQPHWRASPELAAFLKGAPVTADSLKRAFQKAHPKAFSGACLAKVLSLFGIHRAHSASP